MKTHVLIGALTVFSAGLTVFGMVVGRPLGGLGLTLFMSSILFHVVVWGGQTTGVYSTSKIP